MTIQSIQKMMGPTVFAILTALYEGLARYGCGVAGLPYYEDD
jgi:hypothetical protein